MIWEDRAVITIIIVGSAFIYFLPTIFAVAGKNHNSAAIFVLNLTLGWTGLGWVGALVWAFIRPAPTQKPPE